MTGHPQPAPSERAGIELTALRAMLQSPGLAREFAGRLSASHFAEPLHQVLFAELQASLSMGAQLNQAELQSQLTRRGFPDVDLTPYFLSVSLSNAELAALCRQLLTAGIPETPGAGNTSN